MNNLNKISLFDEDNLVECVVDFVIDLYWNNLHQYTRENKKKKQISSNTLYKYKAVVKHS